MYVYVSSVAVYSLYLAVMCIYAIYKCLCWAAISTKIWTSQAEKKPSKAIDGKLFSVLSHETGEIPPSY
jgi:hypothetical protein